MRQQARFDAMAMANDIEAVKNAIGDTTIRKIIYVPGKILNVIAK